MLILAIDPAGNHGREGFGTTGLCIMQDGVVKDLDDIQAKDFLSPEQYWYAHVKLLENMLPDHVVLEGYKLYHHKGQEAKAQANSELETPQLIGIIKMACYQLKIPITVQFANQVKTRWSEKVLVNLGILQENESKTRLYWNGIMTVTHTRDALKHALHWYKYGQKDVK